MVGDPCSEDLDCLPAPPTGDPPNLMNTNLFCDRASGIVPPVSRRLSRTAGALRLQCTRVNRADRVLPGRQPGRSFVRRRIVRLQHRRRGHAFRNGCTLKCAHSGECPTGATCLVGEGLDPTLSCAAPALAPDGYCAPRSGSPPLSCQSR
jgi:hypothetical protein